VIAFLRRLLGLSPATPPLVDRVRATAAKTSNALRDAEDARGALAEIRRTERAAEQRR
jgi:hypothetical protein